jgi:hypothetical protein
MAILRYFAGPIGRRLSPTGILLCSAILSGLGLVWLSYAESLPMALAAGTVFALGVAYFWPTMIGITSERVPKGGALALAVMGATGAVFVGIVTAPMMGRVADRHANEKLPVEGTLVCLRSLVEDYSDLKARVETGRGDDIQLAINDVRNVLAVAERTGALPEIDTANALRSAITVDPQSVAATQAKELLGPAENYGGRISFRWVALLTVLLTAIFGVLFVSDRLRGGYQVERLTCKDTA